ncbi:hypothetical protein [Cupriavidus pinatubonensis]|uniref:hypothetical protein n=1 Tax=Cupriavidus pinatubonensis TaxID=248026 RepID=UPI00112DF654|nr:hypothetical protein [Cupriavidus pinatubonensis]
MKRTLPLVVATFVLASCATVDSLHRGGGGSSFQVRGKTYDEIWKASVRSVSTGLTIVQSRKEFGEIKAESRAGIATWGEVVGVFISPVRPGAASYTVEVQSLKRSMAQITGQDWEESVKTSIKAELDM